MPLDDTNTSHSNISLCLNRLLNDLTSNFVNIKLGLLMSIIFALALKIISINMYKAKKVKGKMFSILGHLQLGK